MTFESILDAAANLPLELRMRLVDELTSTFPEDDSPKLSPEWEAELDRRWRAYEAGETQAVPWEEVRRKLADLGRPPHAS